jgi:alcohol dehydrogenase class IV
MPNDEKTEKQGGNHMGRFTLPRDLYHGKGTLETLKTFEGKKAVVCVGGGSMKKFGFLDRAVSYLKEAGMDVKLIEGIEPDPSVETVMKGAQTMLEFEPDWIIAIGGGSPIDAAKAMWIKYEYPEITFEEMCVVFGIPKLRKKARFCAIASTSGTATEVTAFSIITDYEKGIKYPIADYEITPDVAIIDPDLAETMPPKLVAHTGMDAMTHAVEAYVSTANSDFTDPLALHAIKMIQTDLIPSFNGDMDKRGSMHNAQCLAGMAFTNALLGIVHSMAHKTGAAFDDYGAHIIHGAANAMYLPKVIAFNAKDETAKKRYGQIADFMNLGGSSDDEKVGLLIEHLRNMSKELKIPHGIGTYDADSYPAEQGFVPEEVFLDRLHDIAVNALADACTGSNPRQPTVEEMEKLLKCCYYDTEVDF